MQSDYETAQATASEPIYDTIEYIEMSPLKSVTNDSAVSTSWTVKGLSDIKMWMIFFSLLQCEKLYKFELLFSQPNSPTFETEKAT